MDHVVGDVEGERRVPAQVAPQVVVVPQHDRITEDPIELKMDTLAFGSVRQHQLAPVPADACLREVAPDGLAALAVVHRLRIRPLHVGLVVGQEGELHSPVMRQVQQSPCAVIEVVFANLRHITCFGEGALPFRCAEAEVACLLRCVAKVEAPIEVQQQTLARRSRAGVSGYGLQRGAGHGLRDRRCERSGAGAGERPGGGCKTRLK